MLFTFFILPILWHGDKIAAKQLYLSIQGAERDRF